MPYNSEFEKRISAISSLASFWLVVGWLAAGVLSLLLLVVLSAGYAETYRIQEMRGRNLNLIFVLAAYVIIIAFMNAHYLGAITGVENSRRPIRIARIYSGLALVIPPLGTVLGLIGLLLIYRVRTPFDSIPK